MLKDALDIQSWTGNGYRSLVYSDGWRAAILNDVDRFYRENVNELQRHNTSDELFVLLKGDCTLLIGEEKENGDIRLTAVPLKPGIFYTIRRGIWHSHILEKGTSVAVIENRDVGPVNTDYLPIVLSEMVIHEGQE